VEAGRVILEQVLLGISKSEQKKLIELLLRVKANTAMILVPDTAA